MNYALSFSNRSKLEPLPPGVFDSRPNQILRTPSDISAVIPSIQPEPIHEICIRVSPLPRSSPPELGSIVTLYVGPRQSDASPRRWASFASRT